MNGVYGRAEGDVLPAPERDAPRVTGTFTFHTTAEVHPGGFVCNAASNIRLIYDSPSDTPFPTVAGGINAVPAGS